MLSAIKGSRVKPRLGDKKPGFWLCYTLVFAVVFAIAYSFFFFSGKLMVWYDDGRSQHLSSLMYLGVWLRETLGGLFKNHSLNIATYSFGFGYGGDIIRTLSYYVFGDPLDLLSVFVPSSKTYILYHFLIVLRLYLAGMAFCWLCRVFSKNKSYSATLAGSVIYVFSGFALFSATRHPYFVNPMIYFPIMLVGVEKIRRREAPYVFVIGVFLSAISNFYFFYMTVIFTVLYVIFKLVATRKELTVKDALLFLAKLLGCSLLAVVMAGAVILPTVLQFIGDPRAVAGNSYDLLYNREYYDGILNTVIAVSPTNEEWTYIGMGGVFLPSLFALFSARRSRGLLKAGFVVLTLFLLIPTAGHIFNGMSYPSNRWTWAYALLAAYIVVDTADDLKSMSRARLAKCGIFVLAYALACVLLRASLTAAALAQLFIAMAVVCACLFISLNDKEISKRVTVQRAMLAAAVIGVGFNAVFGFSQFRSDFLEKYEDASHFTERFNSNEAALLDKKYPSGFYRYTGTNLFRNAAMLHKNSSTQYFFSLSNPNIFEFFRELDLPISMGQLYFDLDDRASLNTLANVKYYASGETVARDGAVKLNDIDRNRVPYGFAKYAPDGWVYDYSGKAHKLDGSCIVDSDDVLASYNIYKNRHTLPFGYTYSSYLDRETYNKYSSAEKQEAIMQSVVLDKSPSGVKKGSPELTVKELDYTVKALGDKVTQVDKNTFVSTDRNAKIVLSFDGLENSETYLSLSGTDFKGVRPSELYGDNKDVDPQNKYGAEAFDRLSKSEQNTINRESEYYREPSKLFFNVIGKSAETKVTKRFGFYTSRYKWYENKHDYMINLGYEKTAKKKIILNLPYAGRYSFDDIKVICQPMDNYVNRVKALGEDKLENVSFHAYKDSNSTNEITGEISVKENKILLLTIPYSDGWTACVDGKRTDLLRANTMFSAIELSKGRHTVRLNYDTPGLKHGILMSFIGVILFAALILFGKLFSKWSFQNRGKHTRVKSKRSETSN